MPLFRLSIIVISFCLVFVTTRSAVAEITKQNSDADVLGIIINLDQNIIQAAQLAEQKNIDTQVLDYARMLDAGFTDNLDRTRKLSQDLGMTIVDNGSMGQLRHNGEKDLDALTALDALDFAQLYVADMIKEYSEALNWIDVQDGQKEQVKDLLKETQQNITIFFKKAQEIQKYQGIGQT